MENCIFCKIINGEIPCNKIYEDDNVIAFLDKYPQSKGHVLVLPKKHSSNIFEISEDDLEDVMEVVQKLAKRINEKYKPLGIKIVQNNGEKAGQSIPHFHVHIKPFYENTKASDTFETVTQTDSEIEEIIKELTFLEEL